jgi:hypothetical protein
MPIITGPSGSTGPSNSFEIRGLDISNLISYGSIDYTVSPSTYGLSSDSKLISASILQDDISFKLTVFDTSDNKVITDSNISSPDFSGIKVDLYDSSRNFIRNLVSSTKSTNITLNSSSISNTIEKYTGYANLNDFRTFFVDFTSYSVNGNSDVYRSILTYPEIQITGVEFTNTNPLQVAPLLNDYTYAKNISVTLVADPNDLPSGNANLFDFQSGYSTQVLNYQNNRVKTFFEIVPPVSGADYVDYTDPFNFVFLPYDYFNTGNYFLSSGVKAPYYLTETIPSSLNNLTGFI